MNPWKIIVPLVLAVLLGGLVWFSYSTHGKLQLARAETEQVKAELVSLETLKAESDAAVADLTVKLNTNQEVVTKTITKLVKVPVTVQESCMSPVLQEALREEY